MTVQEVPLIATTGSLPDGVTLANVRTRTAISSAGRDEHASKHHQIVHTIEVRNTTRRKLKFDVVSFLPGNKKLVYPASADQVSWAEEVMTGGITNGRDKPSWDPTKAFVEHPATCPDGNGHHTDIVVKVSSALEGEHDEVIIGTEDQHVYRFTCAC